MGYSTKYFIEFSDTETSYKVEFQQDNYIGEVKELTATSTPVIIEYPVEEIYAPVVGCGATISFFSDGNDVSDLYSINPFYTKVLLKDNSDNIINTYWVNSESFFEDYDVNSLIEITVNDGLNALNRVPYFTDTSNPHQLGREKVSTIIATCLNDLNINNIYTASELKEENHSTVAELYQDTFIDLSNFIDEDLESLSKREVLEMIMLSYGMTLKIANNSAWLYQPNYLIDNTSWKKYDSSFVYISTININNTLIYDTDYEFINKPSSEIISGYNRLIFNYSAYPDPKKIIPFSSDFKTFSDTYTSHVWVDILNNGNTTEGYYYQLCNDKDFTDTQNVEFKTGGYLIKMVEGENTLTPNDEDYDIYFGGAGYETANIGNSIFSVSGGWVNKMVDTNDEILIKSKVRLQSATLTSETIQQIYIPITIKVDDGNGNVKYGKQYGTSIIEVNNDTPYTCYVRASDFDADIINKELDLSIMIRNIAIDGNITIDVKHGFNAYYNYGANVWADCKEYWATFLLFKDFDVLLNREAINDDDIEFGGETGIDYSKNHTIDINLADANTGLNYTLDRGLLTTSTGVCKNWYLNDEGITPYYSLDEQLLRMYLSQYTSPYRRLSGTIISNRNMYKANGTSYYKVLMPYTIISDFENRKYINVGGTYDMAKQQYSGTFEQIRSITEDLV